MSTDDAHARMVLASVLALAEPQFAQLALTPIASRTVQSVTRSEFTPAANSG
jgi:hypothetical protein